MLKQTNHNICFRFNGVILKHRGFSSIILSELLPWNSSKMSRHYLKNVNGDEQYKQILMGHWNCSPHQRNVLVAPGCRYIFKHSSSSSSSLYDLKMHGLILYPSLCFYFSGSSSWWFIEKCCSQVLYPPLVLEHGRIQYCILLSQGIYILLFYNSPS